MKKIEMIALLTDSKKIIELLQRRGVVELCENPDEELMDTSVAAVVSEFEKRWRSLRSMLPKNPR